MITRPKSPENYSERSFAERLNWYDHLITIATSSDQDIMCLDTLNKLRAWHLLQLEADS